VISSRSHGWKRASTATTPICTSRMLIKAENDVAGTAAASVDPDATVPSIRPVTKQVKVNGLPPAPLS